MAKILSSAVFVFTILSLACVLNALEDDLRSNPDGLSKDSAEVGSSSTSFNNPSERIINPSAGSKEEEDNLKSGEDKNMKNKKHDMLFFDDESSLWNMKKFFRYFESLLHTMNEEIDGSLDTSADNEKLKNQKTIGNNPAESIVLTEKPSSVNDNTLNKSEDGGNMQNFETDILNKPKDSEKKQNSGSNDILSKSDDEKNQKSGTPDTSGRSDDNEKMDDLADTDTFNKSPDSLKMQNLSKNTFMNRKEQTEDLKNENGSSMDKDSVDKSEKNKKAEKQNLANIKTLDKSADYEDTQKSSSSDHLSNAKPTKNFKSRAQNSMDKDSTNESENNIEIKRQNSMESITDDSDDQIKSPDEKKIQNSATSNALNESENDKKIENSSDFYFSNTESLRNGQQNSMTETHLEKLMNKVKGGSPVIHNAKLSRKNNKLKEDIAKITSKRYEVCNDDSEEADTEDEDENNNEKVNGNDLNENNLDEDEAEDDYEMDNDSEDETENNYVNNNLSVNENDTNPNRIENKIVNENNDNGGNEFVRSNQNLQTVDERAPNASITLPKFLVQVMQGPQNHSADQPSKGQNDNDDAVLPEVTGSQNLTKEEKILQEVQLSNSEFLDSYINNPKRNTLDRKYKESNNAEVFTSNRNNPKKEEIQAQIPISDNKYENDKSLNTASLNNENMNNRKMPIDQSQNIEHKFPSENNGLPLPVINSGRKVNNHNKSPMKEGSSSENIIPASIFQEVGKTNEIKPLNFIPLEETLYRGDLLQPFEAPHFLEPFISDFQNNEVLLNEFHKSAPTMNEYRPQTITSLPLSPNKPIFMQNENDLSNQNLNYNFQNVEIPRMNYEFDQVEKIASEQDIFPVIQNLDFTNTPDKMPLKNHEPMNLWNTEMPAQIGEISSSYLISDDLQSYLTINPIYNEDFLPVNTENGVNNVNKIESQDQLDKLKLPNPINNANDKEILNLQTESADQPFQDKLTEPQQQSLEKGIGKTSLQSELNNNDKIESEILSSQNDSSNLKLSLSQKDIENSNNLSQPSFNITEDDIRNNISENKTSFPVIQKIYATKSPSLQTKTESSKPLNDKKKKNIILDKTVKQEQKAQHSNSNDVSLNGSSNRDYDNKDAKEDDEEFIDLSDEENPDDNEIEDDFGNEDEDETDDEDEDENDEDDEEDEEDESEEEEREEDKYIDDEDGDEKDTGDEEEEEEDGEEDNDEDKEYNGGTAEKSYDYDENKDNKNGQNPQAEVTGEKTHESDTTSPSVSIQRKTGKQIFSKIQPSVSGINNYDNNTETKDDKSHNNANDENQMQIIEENASRVENYATEQQELQSGLSPSNQEEKYDTILEYIYKFSDNPLFNGIKEEKNQTA